MGCCNSTASAAHSESTTATTVQVVEVPAIKLEEMATAPQEESPKIALSPRQFDWVDVAT